MKTQVINRFIGNYYFLSNFYLGEIEFDGITYPSSENVFQALKSVDPRSLKEFANISPGEAKAKGRKIKCRADWDGVKVDLMKDILRVKFENMGLRTNLLLTEKADLVEGNDWHDNFWGTCTCHKCIHLHNEDSNTLGKLLMEVRKEKMETLNDFRKM